MLVSFFTGEILLGQDNLTGYFQPDISLDYKVAKNYSHNFELSQQNYFYDGTLQVRTKQLDITHFSRLKIADNQSIAFGIKYRFRHIFEENKGNELRLTQQYNITQSYGNVRFGDRLRAEQRITSALTTHRFRYRLAMDLPLSGEKLEVGEAYFVASTESLLSVAHGQGPEYDQRLTLTIGWLLNQGTQLRVGSEYRIENYTQKPENVLVLLTGLVFSL